MHINPKILFVDDEPHEIKYFKKAFEKEFTIETANSVSAAKQILSTNHDSIAIVITDHRMPKEVGLELLKYSQDKYPSIIRMLTTACCDFNTAVNAINDVDIYKYITKPWNINELEHIIRKGLEHFHKKTSEAADSEESILDKFTKDCNHWLEYSLHAYGDEYVYRSGIEALACQYQIKIKTIFDNKEKTSYSDQLTKIINNNFLSEEVLNTLKTQENIIFSTSNSSVSQRKH